MLSWCIFVLCRRKLEEKARLYEQMTKGDFPGTCLLTIPNSNISLLEYTFTLLWVFCKWTDIEVDNFFLYLDEETESLFLVDFTQKIINQRNEPQTCTADEAGYRDGEDSDVNVPVPDPQNANEEWYGVFINIFWTWLRGNVIWTPLWVFLLAFSLSLTGWTMLMH